MKITSILNESKQFSEPDFITLDPDRADSHDVVDKILPSLVRMAYVQFVDDKNKHEKRFGDDEEMLFKFTADELRDRLEDLIGHVVDKLKDLSSKDLDRAIDSLKSEYKTPLEKE